MSDRTDPYAEFLKTRIIALRLDAERLQDAARAAHLRSIAHRIERSLEEDGPRPASM